MVASPNYHIAAMAERSRPDGSEGHASRSPAMAVPCPFGWNALSESRTKLIDPSARDLAPRIVSYPQTPTRPPTSSTESLNSPPLRRRFSSAPVRELHGLLDRQTEIISTFESLTASDSLVHRRSRVDQDSPSPKWASAPTRWRASRPERPRLGFQASYRTTFAARSKQARRTYDPFLVNRSGASHPSEVD